jgi:hypothetical protein
MNLWVSSPLIQHSNVYCQGFIRAARPSKKAPANELGSTMGFRAPNFRALCCYEARNTKTKPNFQNLRRESFPQRPSFITSIEQ